MEQNANIFSQLYWGGVIAAVIYGLLISVPVIAKLMFGNRECIDCRSRRACICLEYRLGLADDIAELRMQVNNMLNYYSNTGEQPSQLNDSTERHLRLFIVQLDSTAELLKSCVTTVRSCFDTIDGFSTFFDCLDGEPNLQAAVSGMNERRHMYPMSWPPEPRESS